MKIFLTGFMGSGKTSLGKRLARKMNYNFIDLDSYIENKESKKIPRIFASYGEERFRIIEAENLRLLESLDNVIISTGGGAPCFQNNMEWMNEKGLTIYLKQDVNSLFQRLKQSKKKRPLIAGMSKKKLYNYIEDTLKEREVYYNRASLIIEAKSLKAKELKEQIEAYRSS